MSILTFEDLKWKINGWKSVILPMRFLLVDDGWYQFCLKNKVNDVQENIKASILLQLLGIWVLIKVIKRRSNQMKSTIVDKIGTLITHFDPKNKVKVVLRWSKIVKSVLKWGKKVSYDRNKWSKYSSCIIETDQNLSKIFLLDRFNFHKKFFSASNPQKTCQIVPISGHVSKVKTPRKWI